MMLTPLPGIGSCDNGPSAMSSSKRPRTESQSPSVSGRSDCRYEGCTRPTQEKERAKLHEFCGAMHRNLFMADLANRFGAACGEGEPVVYGNYQICKLPGCGKPVSVDAVTGECFDFCRKAHVLKFVEIYTPLWRAKGRICKLEPCVNHVCVNEDSKKCYEFCSFSHAELASARKGLQMKVDDDPPHGALQSVFTHCQDILQPKTEMIEGKHGYHVAILDSDLEGSLRAALLGGDLMQYPNLVTNVDIREFHPWELVKGFTPRFFLFFKEQVTGGGAKSRQKKVQTLTTKDGFGWKQTSAAYAGTKLLPAKLSTKYYSYELKDSKLADKNLPHVRCYQSERQQDSRIRRRWKMHEISLVEEMSRGSNREDLNHRRPVIWKLFQERLGEPVWPPVPVDAESSTAHPEERTELISRTGSANTSMFKTVGISGLLTPHTEERLYLPSRVASQETPNQSAESSTSLSTSSIRGNEILESLDLADLAMISSTDGYVPVHLTKDNNQPDALEFAPTVCTLADMIDDLMIGADEVLFYQTAR